MRNTAPAGPCHPSHGRNGEGSQAQADAPFSAGGSAVRGGDFPARTFLTPAPASAD
jgi:hypothetical protein